MGFWWLLHFPFLSSYFILILPNVLNADTAISLVFSSSPFFLAAVVTLRSRFALFWLQYQRMCFA